ncbi:MAG: hypothetical protein NTV54_10695 [Ignavibacteriales bacterium]|nr:hypothetical protein [Ignavibacteriales bacterium]
MKRMLLFCGFSAWILIGCSSGKPDTFAALADARWDGVILRAGMSYDDAWQKIVYIIARRFDIEMVLKDEGYLRTAWSFSKDKNGRVLENNRDRAIVKFTADKKKVEFKVEHQFNDRDCWIAGADTSASNQVLKGISMSVGQPVK